MRKVEVTTTSKRWAERMYVSRVRNGFIADEVAYDPIREVYYFNVYFEG